MRETLAIMGWTGFVCFVIFTGLFVFFKQNWMLELGRTFFSMSIAWFVAWYFARKEK